jgi:NAD(P)-dependent dehydrogenase (short-subunit alcohol dehydrogenase family)
MGNKLKDKVAIITGGGRGIGRAIAEAYTHEGATVIITAAKNNKEIEETAINLNAFPMLSDVTKKDQVDHLINEVLNRFGKIDILVNNAARGMKFVNQNFMTDPIPFWQADQEMWQMVINTNINGVFLVTRAVVLQMLKQKSGTIINISINLETMKRKGFTPYGPSKAALESMSTIWAQELEGSGINLNVLLPGGATLTGMIPENYSQDQKASLLKPEIVGPAAVYLASDEAKHSNGKRIIATEWNKEHGINI